MDWMQMLAAALIAATIAAVSTHILSRSAVQAAPAIENDQPSAHAAGRHRNWWRGRAGRRFHSLCGERYNERLEWLADYAEDELKLTEPQRQAWADVVAALKDGDGMLAAICEQADGGGAPDGAPAEFARIEGIMTVGLKIVQTVRPAFDGFYQTLDVAQRKDVDRLITRGHHR